ncbi:MULTISPECIES: tryptophan synthase subunit alpha [Thermomonospora]|uniref:Tryptophan synthase alpha chain n=1 Tax=Thermomonospora curvata (strain ATCC 19995 / DSM 43183 / JCM 3096 / KCTC 9072 / NBRC 15933 / NCIMB 10081 / Henssen B9) TaxID=471852 RepID=D1A714_THECD|nr:MULTISPECIES: tryptophan synthase subunit alpha [Thermomonospora]ACY98418.1 tryptophan synthase, alpha subunit [Thermomonospora curvata DSM 43183]PKK13568.1 MAG: tryptophan synthase subunit alpha [Thermomonospora sp. CIF 1]
MSATVAFEKAKAEGRAALVGYLPAGFPSHQGAIAAATAMVEAGCDIIEVGLPYSDPLMDGPTIQDAVHRALTGGTRVADVLRTVEAIAATGAPTLVMTYWNPIDRYGVDAFARDLKSAGGAGLITPDLTPEEAEPWLAASDAHDLDRVFLVALTSTEERLTKITNVCRGFVYAASLMGVTGTRSAVNTGAPGLVERTRKVLDRRPPEAPALPIGLGLGVSNGEQAAEVASFADGVIVGSAFVRRLLDAPDEASAVRAVGEFAAELAEGVRRGA